MRLGGTVVIRVEGGRLFLLFAFRTNTSGQGVSCPSHGDPLPSGDSLVLPDAFLLIVDVVPE